MTENSAMTTYFQKLAKLPLLTEDEERDLLARTAQGDAKARDILIERNLRLVVPTAKRYAKSGLQFADLVQEGSRAIIKAVDKFDSSKNVRFSTYATQWIRHYIGRYAKKHGKNVFVPEYVVNLAIQAAQAKNRLMQEGDTEPSDEAVAERVTADFGTKTDAKAVREATESCQVETSMFAKIGDDDTEFGDLLPDNDAADPCDETAARGARDKLELAMRGLTFLERTVLGLRFGIGLPTEKLPVEIVAKTFHASVEEIKDATDCALAVFAGKGAL